MRYLLPLLLIAAAVGVYLLTAHRPLPVTEPNHHSFSEAKFQKHFAELKTMMRAIKESNTSVKLKRVNDFFNAIAYDTDPDVWGEDDYWASRKEFLGADRGDCEDYAIAKYFTLRQLGFPNDTLFLTYVRLAQSRVPHIVLTYYESPDATPLVLDSNDPRILPANQRRDLRPIFNFNADKIYMSKQRGLGRELPGGKINLDKWTELLLKTEEGA